MRRHGKNTLTGYIILIIIVFYKQTIPLVMAETKTSGNIAAMVNNIPIYRETINLGLPKAAFGPRLNKMRSARLDKLIYTIAMKQFLEKQNIHVSKQHIEKQIEIYKKTPPSKDLCCRYESLEKYLEYNAMTLNDLRDEINITKGFEIHIDKLWQEKSQVKKKRLALVKIYRPGIEKRYIKASHIFFSFYKEPQFTQNRKGVMKKKRKQAFTAMDRLENGEKFETVAKEMSDDAVSQISGGALDIIEKKKIYSIKGGMKYWGNTFVKVLLALSPGEYSEPLKSMRGWHIIMCKKFNDKDILEIIKKQFKGKVYPKIEKKIMDQAEIVRY